MLLAALLAASLVPQVQRVEAVVEAEIGAGDAPEVVLGRVPDLAAEAGNVYVLDNQANRVHVFTAAGEHLGSFGRRGGGPDELNRPIRVDVRDGTVTVLNPSGLSSSYTSAGELVGTQRMPLGAQFAVRFSESTYALLSWGGISREAPVPVESLILLREEVPDTVLRVPSSHLLFRTSTSHAALPTSLCSLAYFVVGGGGELWVASGIDGTLTEWGAAGSGELAPGRSLEAAPRGAPLPDSTRARLLEAVPSQVDPQAGELYTPPVLSSICGLERSGDTLWVRLAETSGGERWRAIRTDALVMTAELVGPEGVTISAFSEGRAYGIRTDASGFPIVTVYRLE